jgi:hypothetical protein
MIHIHFIFTSFPLHFRFVSRFSPLKTSRLALGWTGKTHPQPDTHTPASAGARAFILSLRRGYN